MDEQEPKVTPIIRLPQLRAAGKTPPTRIPGPAPEPARERLEALPGEDDAEAEDGSEEEERFDQPLRTQVSGDQARLGDTSGFRSGVSSLLRRALLNFAEQERQRARLVTIFLATQAAILLAILPGYLFGQFQLTGVLVVLGGLALFGIVWLLNWSGRIGEASYLLVLGGGALVALDLLLSAAHLLSLETLHISLLFLLVILAGGILFSPETALIFAAIFALFTVFVLLVFRPSGPLEASFTAQGRYLALVYLVAVQLGVGVVAWLFGRQMQESVHLITYVAGLQMSNKGLHKRLRETAEKKRHLEAGIAIIQQTHARVAAGDYSARAHVEGDLLPLAVSLNLMLERVESFVSGEQKRERMETAVAGLAELAGRVGQESLGQIPVPTGTALDGLSIAIKQMQTNVNQRLGRVQQSVAALMTTVGHCQDDLLPVAEVLQEHLRSIDALVLAADNVLSSAQRQVAFAAQAGELLVSAAPVGVSLKAEEDQAGRTMGTSALRLAEEMERRAAAAASSNEPAPSPEAAAPPTLSSPEPASSSAPLELHAPASEEAPADESAQALEAALPAASSEEPSLEATGAQQPTGEAAAEATPQDVAAPEQPAAEIGQEAAAPDPAPAGQETGGTGPHAAPADTPGESVLPVSPLPEVASAPETPTLAEIDQQVAEEIAGDEPEWGVEHLRELAGVLARMSGEAAQQERNAYTLTYKLGTMLQGMPDSRRVDEMADWLRRALDAIAQSANQVQQASKTIPASAFQAPRKDSAEGQIRD